MRKPPEYPPTFGLSIEMTSELLGLHDVLAEAAKARMERIAMRIDRASARVIAADDEDRPDPFPEDDDFWFDDDEEDDE